MTETSLQFKTAFGLVCLAILVLGGLVFGALATTNPNQIGPVGVTVWFASLMLLLASVIAVGLFLIKSRLNPEDSKIGRLGASWRQGLLLGGSITICLALQSLRQLSLRDALLLIVLIVLTEFYFRTRR